MNGGESNRLIAVDGGGTKTVVLVGDENGHILASVRGGSSNMKSRPWNDVKAELHGLFHEALRQSGTSPEMVKGVVLGLAGADREEDRKRVEQFASPLFPCLEFLKIWNDAVTTLAAGTGGNSGFALIAGTGSICIGFNAISGEYVRVGGWGYVFGDEGSGYDLGRRALQAVVRAYDGRAEKTLLTERVLSKLDLRNPEQLVTAVYESKTMRATVASLSTAVFEASKAGDEAASKLVEEAAAELTLLVTGAYARLAPEEDSQPLVLSGGLFQEPVFRDAFKHRLEICRLPCSICALTVPPVIGSYYLALKQAGRPVNPDMQRRIEQQCRDEGDGNHVTTHQSPPDNGAAK